MATKGFRWEGFFIISGHRTAEGQFTVNPLAPRSLHTYCPSLAVDLRLAARGEALEEFQIYRFLGQHWEKMGNRWGGRFSTPDPNHFDTGLPT